MGKQGSNRSVVSTCRQAGCTLTCCVVLATLPTPASAADGRIQFQGAITAPTLSLPTLDTAATSSSSSRRAPGRVVLTHVPLRVALAVHDPLLDYFAQHVALGQTQLIVATYP